MVEVEEAFELLIKQHRNDNIQTKGGYINTAGVPGDMRTSHLVPGQPCAGPALGLWALKCDRETPSLGQCLARR